MTSFTKIFFARGAREAIRAAGACKSVTGAHRDRECCDGGSIGSGPDAALDAGSLPRRLRSGARTVCGACLKRWRKDSPPAHSRSIPAAAVANVAAEPVSRKSRCSSLSDLYVRCAECEGRRFQPHVLKVLLHGKSIHDLLQMTVSEAIGFFTGIGEGEKLARPSGSSGGGRARLSATRATAQYSFRRRIAATKAR